MIVLVLVFLWFLYHWDVGRNGDYPANSSTSSKGRTKNSSVPYSSKYGGERTVSGRKNTPGTSRSNVKSSEKRTCSIPESSKYKIR